MATTAACRNPKYQCIFSISIHEDIHSLNAIYISSRCICNNVESFRNLKFILLFGFFYLRRRSAARKNHDKDNH